MRGHDSIIALRQTGKIPSTVFLNDYACATDRFETGDHFTVEILPSEQPEWLDLRFLVGLRVSVSGSTENRARRLLEACKLAGAAVIAVGAPADNSDPFCNKSYSEVWRRG